jgi:hypothetical protein
VLTDAQLATNQQEWGQYPRPVPSLPTFWRSWTSPYAVHDRQMRGGIEGP